MVLMLEECVSSHLTLSITVEMSVTFHMMLRACLWIVDMYFGI